MAVSLNALNRISPPTHVNDARIDDFTIVADLAVRTFTVYGDALERFAQMTDWSYFESLLRVQKVLEAAGDHCSLLFPLVYGSY